MDPSPDRTPVEESLRRALRLRQEGRIDDATLADSIDAWLLAPGSNLDAWLESRPIAPVESRDTQPETTGNDIPTVAPTIPDPTIDPYATRAGDALGSNVDPASRIVPGFLRYVSLRSHAKGGLGEVFVAEDVELRRRVALKEIQDRHARNPVSRGRFLVEAEITGSLEHPGIVPVYGLGQYPDGRPYYAMRFVQGETLEQTIRAHFRAIQDDPALRPMGLRALLRRFLDVCNALAYAHSRGILHRDIKPANIMVGRYGETLLVDWGLARPIGQTEQAPAGAEAERIDASRLSGSFDTLPGSLIGTPAYMSPEQAAGLVDQVDARSDVYSLGATLYQILTGSPPLHGLPLEELLARARAADIPASRSVRPDVPKALDAICRKAMARDRGDRHETPSALAADLERWFADEPVSCHQETGIERLARWSRRHRQATVAGAGALVAVALVALVALVLINRARESEAAAKARAEESFRQARDLVDQLTTQLAEGQDLKETPRGDRFRRQLLAQARDYYRSLVTDSAHSEDRSILLETAEAARRLARIDAETGNREEALDSYDEAIGLQTRILRIDPASPPFREALAGSLVSRSILLEDLGKVDDAERDVRQAYTLLDRLAVENPKEPRFRRDAARALNNLSILLKATGRVAESEAAQRRVLALREHAIRDHPTSRDARIDLIISLNNLASLDHAQGKHAQALAAYGRALGLVQEQLESQPDDPDARYIRAGLGQSRGDILAQTGKLDEARASYEQSRDDLDRLVSEHPESAAYLQGLARSHDRLGVLALGTNRDPLPDMKDAIRLFERLRSRHPEMSDASTDLANALGRLGESLIPGRLGFHDLDAAETYLKRAATLLEEAVARTPLSRFRADLANAQRNLGRVWIARKRPDDARKAFERAELLLRDQLAAEPSVVRHRIGLAEVLEHRAHLAIDDEQDDVADPFLVEAIDLLRPLAEQAQPDPLALGASVELARTRSDLLIRQGDVPGAIRSLEHAESLYRRELESATDYRPHLDGLARTLERLADLIDDPGQKRSRRLEVVAIRRRLGAAWKDAPEDQNLLGNALTRLAEDDQDAERPNEAISGFREAMSIHEKLYKASPSREIRLTLSGEAGRLGELLRDTGQNDEALALARYRRALWIKAEPPDPDELAGVAEDLALLLPDDGAPDVGRSSRLDECLEALTLAASAGLGDLDVLAAEGAFFAIRNEPRFRAIADAVRDRAFPDDPFHR